ncbi:MAG: DUF4375 domain-containing protein [Flavobacterium sp.]
MNLIDKTYQAAVRGLKEEWFNNPSLNWFNYIQNLSSQEKTTYCIVVLDNQVFNGGFHQYFSNGYGQFASSTIKALKNIGAVKKANLLNEALQIVNPKNIEDREFALNLLKFEIDPLFKEDTLFEPLEKLDDQYENHSEEDLQILLENFLQVKS